ncbi:MAG: hypothetical protein K0U61_06430 [Alphaproteobacteria bacterium]|nr:hypothetical protein [Alphaproteobacteria bacterium]
MNLLITSGMDHRWCDFAHSQLLKMGLQTPDVGERTGITPEQLTAKMEAAYPTKNRSGDDFTRLKPGRAWELAASDLIISNADKEYWGWCSPSNLHFLDFWSEFEPNTRFVLIYGAAHETLSHMLSKNRLSLEDADRFVASWKEYHERLLRFYHANSERSTLIHVREFEVGEQHIVDLLNARLGISLNVAKFAEVYERSALDELMARHITEYAPSVDSLFEELNNSADIPRTRSNTSTAEDGLNAAEELAELRDMVGGLKLGNEELREQRKQLTLANEELREKRNEMEEAVGKSRNLKSQNLLLSAQLQQLHNDLERRTLHAPEPIEATAQYSDMTQQSAGIHDEKSSIDMTAIISGQGWHDAEPHGRWAGASPRSVLRLPKLSSHRYEVTVRVVDTISLEHLTQLSAYFDDRKLSGRLKMLANLGGRLAPIHRLGAQLRRHPKPVPAEYRAIIPAEWIDNASNAHLLSLASAPPMRPSDHGAGDNRPLSVCVERIEIRKVV